jgi:hypothetical protein
MAHAFHPIEIGLRERRRHGRVDPRAEVVRPALRTRELHVLDEIQIGAHGSVLDDGEDVAFADDHVFDIQRVQACHL